MAFSLDMDYVNSFPFPLDGPSPFGMVPAGDYMALKAMVGQLTVAPEDAPRPYDDVKITELTFKTRDDADMKLLHFEKEGSIEKAAVVYVHGGGRVNGAPDTPFIDHYVHDSGVQFFSVDYRMAPEYKSI